MELKDRLREASTQSISHYELTDGSKTTGLATLPKDINAYNSWGMTPLHVALQSGSLDELDTVLARPDLDVKKPSAFGQGPEMFINIFKTYNYGQEGVANAMTQKLQDRLRADAFVGPKPATLAI